MRHGATPNVFAGPGSAQAGGSAFEIEQPSLCSHLNKALKAIKVLHSVFHNEATVT